MSTVGTPCESGGANNSKEQQSTVSSSSKPMDLAPRGPSVLQLRPARPFTPITQPSKGGTSSPSTLVPTTQIINVNRPTSSPNPNTVTLLPRSAATYQLTRVTRPSTTSTTSMVSSSQGQASITVTPLPTPNIRLAPGGTPTHNNGAWGTVSPIRAATITVGGRPIRPDGKIIQIPQQHVTQLQMVDGKGSILKPQQITTTPIVNIRGTLPGGATSGSSVTFQPLTIRTANIATIQQRPMNATMQVTNPIPKVITQPAHTAPILVNANKNVIQTITPLPKISTVCLTLSTNANLTTNSSSPVVAVASRQGGTPSLIMTPSTIALANASGAATTTALPITKVYPVGRDGTPVSIVDNIFSGASASVNISTPSSTSSTPGSSVVVASSAHPQHVLVHATPTINVHAQNHTSGLGHPHLAPGSIAPGYFVDKNFQMNIVPHGSQTRPITLDSKKIDPKSLPPGSMIIAASGIPLSASIISQPVPGSTQSASSTSATSVTSAQILAQIPHSLITSGAPTITLTPSASSQNQSIPISIPAHVISQVSGTSAGSVLTVTTTTISSSTSNTSSSSMSTTTASTNTSSVSTSSTCTSSTTAPPAQSPNHNPNANNNNNNNANSTKATHSPRPSILRKREHGGDHHHQGHGSSRAQRNLNLQLNFASSNTATTTTPATTPNHKEKAIDKFSSSTVGGEISSLCAAGVSILKKEFQPPTEESSWQSVSSNSSSGSSTISTTSETAELQLQQQLGVPVDLNLSTSLPLHSSESSGSSAFVGVGLGAALCSGKSTSSLSLGMSLGASSNTTTSHNQNGVLRSTQPRSRSSSTSKAAVERLKAKDKDHDGVSPRKKPRKQQLTSSDLLEAASPEIYYQGKGKRFRKGELMDFSESTASGEKERTSQDPMSEELPPAKPFYYIKRRHMSLLQSNSILPKALTTHFLRYCDVKAKEEKRPTISELANEKNIYKRVSGWRVQAMAIQMQELVENETEVIDKCSTLLTRLENKVGPTCADRDLNIVMELLKGNIQRCKVIRDQISDSKAQAVKILDHHPHILEVVNKYCSKRPLAKKRNL